MTQPALRVPHTSCIVATTPRSGSWLLSSAMQDSGRLGTPEEYFRPDATALWAAEWDVPLSGPYGVYVRHALDYGTGDNGVFSVKLHWYQLLWFVQMLRPLRYGEWKDLPALELLGKWLPNPHFVYLHRRDSARQALSFFRAARSGMWFVPADRTGQMPADRIDLDRTPLTDEEWAHVRFLEQSVTDHNEDWLGFFEEQDIMPLEVAYEDFAADYAGTIGRIVDYVGSGTAADVAGMVPSLAKQADELTEVWLEQYLERRDSLTPKPFPKDRKPRVALPVGFSPGKV